MPCKLYANIGVGHENDFTVLERRIIAAAQCNADAVIISKSTPVLVIPEEKKYVAIPSKWGTLPYIEVAKRSELSASNLTKIVELCNQIGIPLIWSVTDMDAMHFVKEYADANSIKIHYNAVDPIDMVRSAADMFDTVYVSHLIVEEAQPYLRRRGQLNVFYTTEQFPPETNQLNFSIIDKLIKLKYTVGYEGREAGIFPAIALAYAGIEYIEKYLGDEDSDNSSVLTPEQFMDLFTSLDLLQTAKGT